MFVQSLRKQGQTKKNYLFQQHSSAVVGVNYSGTKFAFARKNDIKPVVQQTIDRIEEIDIKVNFEEQMHERETAAMLAQFEKYAQVPADGYKISPHIMDRIKTFYIEKGVRENNIEDKKDFLDLVHDFEVYIRDSDMFESTEREDMYDIIEQDDTFFMSSEPGIGFAGDSFELNSKFDLRDANALEPGYATAEGTKSYAQRSKVVHPSNFCSVAI